ncbi:phosphoribosyltransferase [Pyrolobus fumarii 1A]|uniref:Phosphoribosyltransferase n=1 Tax=Pyrolobus fumarii (strain DSM 11204 / 1A) TaxID=694429 RepID=G0EEH8_PYRF1|nr:phosphoribosyltransferase [Pyrolobus fumarii]AEM38019.1 phosphoribosyltransferase [Pyrolobus fumarii 1A]
MPRVPVKLVTWDEIVEWAYGLAKKIREDGYKPTVIIAVARGGYVPARLLCDFLGVENLLSIQSQHWVAAAQASEKAILKFPYHVDLSGHRALIVDDIVDTGETLMLAKEFVQREWKPDELKVAALQWISTVAKFKPDYYYIEVREWVWFQYPWTRLEDTMQFIKRMMEEAAREEGKREWTYDEIKKKFVEWYGVDVGDLYYREALLMLEERGIVERKDNVYVYKG